MLIIVTKKKCVHNGQADKKFQMGPVVDSTSVMNGSDINDTGVFYGVIDKANGTYKLYNGSLELLNTQAIDTAYGSIPVWAFSSGAKAIDFGSIMSGWRLARQRSSVCARGHMMKTAGHQALAMAR